MHAIRQLSRRLRLPIAGRRLGTALREAALLAAAVGALESFGRYSPHDGADLLGLTFAGVLAFLLARTALRGWMPATSQVAALVTLRVLGAVRGLSTQTWLSLRPPPASVSAVPDRALLAPAWALLAACAAALAAREHVLEGLLFVKAHVSYTLYLVGLTALWTLFGGTAVLGILSGSGGRGGAVAWTGKLLLWSAVLLLVSILPGAIVLAVAAGTALFHAIRIHGSSPATYFLCRSEEGGRIRSVPVHEYLRRLHAVLVLALFLAAVLGQSHRLTTAVLPTGPMAFTVGLGLLASVCAVLLIGRAGNHVLALLRSPQGNPEAPLPPTLWVRDARAVRGDWAADAERQGWVVARTTSPPSDGYDLVVGGSAEPRSFVPPSDLAPEDARFRMERRFHVVKRRQFFRRFHRLFKQVTREDHAVGSGYLFCPHVWLIRGIVRDVEEGPRGPRAPGGLFAGKHLGRSYAETFPPRVRRYLGGVLRALEIDMVFWEDAIDWAELRGVFGVAFEMFDQGRIPLEERHFVGVPRVRVVIQEEDDEAADGAAAGDPAGSLRARVLLVLKDRGGGKERIEADAPGGRRRHPLPA